MKPTYRALQQSPRAARPQDARCRRALEAAAAHLECSAQHLAATPPEYRQALACSLTSLRQAYTALLEYHSFPPGIGATLAEMSAPAEGLVSMLRIYNNRALPLEDMAEAIPDGRAPLAVREAVEMSFFLARDTLSVVLGSLPEALTEGAIRPLNRAQAIRMGRLNVASAATSPGLPRSSPATALA